MKDVVGAVVPGPAPYTGTSFVYKIEEIGDLWIFEFPALKSQPYSTGFFYSTTWAEERGESLQDLEFFP